MSNTIANAVRPLLWLQDAMIISFLLTITWFLVSAAYYELRYGMDFKAFRRKNAYLLPFVFGVLLCFITAAIWWFKGFL